MKFDWLKLGRRDRAKTLLEKAQQAQRQSRWAEAYDVYRQVLRNDGRRFGILVQMGHMSKEQGKFEEAEAHYIEALASKPDDWDLHLQIGHLHNRKGDLAAAKEWYLKADAIQSDTELRELLSSLENIKHGENTRELREVTLKYMDSRQFQKALNGAQALYEVYGLQDFDVILGHTYRELGRYAEAEGPYRHYFERCLAQQNKYLEDAFWHLVNILNLTGNDQEIFSVFVRLKERLHQEGRLADVGDRYSTMLSEQVGKIYGVLRG